MLRLASIYSFIAHSALAFGLREDRSISPGRSGVSAGTAGMLRCGPGEEDGASPPAVPAPQISLLRGLFQTCPLPPLLNTLYSTMTIARALRYFLPTKLLMRGLGLEWSCDQSKALSMNFNSSAGLAPCVCGSELKVDLPGCIFSASG